MVNCKFCGTPLRAIGKDRENGRSYSGNGGYDWDNRLYHKKCYKEILMDDYNPKHYFKDDDFDNYIEEEIKKLEKKKVEEIKNECFTITVYELDL